MAHLLIIELPGGNDLDIIQAAIDRGDEFTFLSAQLQHYHQQPLVHKALSYASQLIEVTSFDYGEVENIVVEIHAKHPFDAILCLIDIRLTEAARLSAKLGLRYLNVATSFMMRDKYSVRRRLRERGIVQPVFELATSNDELKLAVDKIGLPVLIKPADGYGSQNIVVLRYPEDLDPLLTPLDDLLPCKADYGLGVTSNDRMLVEEYMDGSIIGCDVFTINGQHRLLGVNEKLFFEPPSFAIRGGCFTPSCPDLKDIQQYVFSLLDAVEFDWGATHTELMLTSDGPRLIEINPRLVGAKIPRLVGQALNRSIHADLIALHVGDFQSANDTESNMVAVSRWIVADQVGILAHVQLPSWQDTRIRYVEILKKSGDRVRPPMENADRIGYVMVCASTRVEAEELAERFVSQTVVELQ